MARTVLAARAGTSPVSVTAPGQTSSEKKPLKAGGAAAGQVQVTILDQAAVDKAGVKGVVFTVGRTDQPASGTGKPGAVGVRLDYSGFAQAFGGAYGTRLRLLRYPGCVLTTPQRPECQKAVQLPSTNDATNRILSADVEAAPLSTPSPSPSPSASPSAAGQPTSSSSPSPSPTVSPTRPLQTRRTAVAPAADSAQQPTVLAVAAASSGTNGSYAATDLAPSATWNVGGNTGDFNWSYPMKVPPVPGGLTPKLALTYNSANTDGRTSNTGNQPSWIGEGFDMWPGYIERRYESCKDAGAPKDSTKGYPGDQCWGYDNATLTWTGKGGQLIPDGKGKWHLKDDDGTRIEKLTGADNGDNDGEYWKVTTSDGVQYYFGRNTWTAGKPTTGSAWTEPVFGVHSGDPCNKSSGFADSWCNQAYRWNLDYVVDPRGNAIVYYYGKETNYYGRNLSASDETAYTRGGWLDHIDYGLRSDNLWPAHAPARVDFQTAERCISATSSDCNASNITAHPELWQDTPWDLHCDSGQDCKDNHGTLAPTFWSRKRLTKVTTRVAKDDGSDWRDVDSWSLTHEWRDADVDRDLVLSAIQHTGLAGTDAGGDLIKLPAVQLGYQQMANRVDVEGDYFSTFIRYRLQSIADENGGQTMVSYSLEDCAPGKWPTPESNTSRCFPVIEIDPTGTWDSEKTVTNWYNKYVVTSIKQTDLTGYAADIPVTTYDYQDGAAWHYADDDGLTKAKFKTWSQYRGYRKVITRTGLVNNLMTQSAAYYMRGMDGDRKDASGGTKSVSVPDGEGTSYPDHESAQGFQIRTETFDKADGAIIGKTVAEPWHNQTATQTRSWGTVTANQTGTKTTRGFNKLSNGSWRETKTVNNAFDSITGAPTESDNFGDVTKPEDDQCTTTSYAQSGDTSAWIVSLPSQVQTVATTCANKNNVDYTKQLVSASRTYYDGSALGVAPTVGLVTRTDKVSTTTTASQLAFVPAAKASYDSYGRQRTSVVADNTTGTEVDKTTTTSYTASTGGLTTGVSTSQPPVTINGTSTALTTSQTIDTATGQPLTKTDEGGKTTNLRYDALGRTSKVWQPGRASAPRPDYEFTYQVELGKIVAVGTTTLHNDSTPTTSYTFYDGLLRPRQTQTPGPNGGRLVAETFYNALGKPARTYNTYYADGAPTPALFGVDTPGNVESQHTYDYDGLARVTADHFWVGQGSRAVERWKTTTDYNGESTTVTPPEGGTKTTALTDAQGRTVETRQYTGTGASDYLFSSYTYTPTGKPATITGPGKAGTIPATTWSYDYDVRGRKTSQTDPDSGTTHNAYDDLDRLTQTTDARGKKIATSYDNLGRKAALTDVTSGTPGTKLADWTYDTIVKGQPTSSSRYIGDLTYTTAVSLYDNLNRPTRTYVRIPTAPGQDKLAGTYIFGSSYNLDNTLSGQSYPAAGGLTAETVTVGYDGDQLGRPMKLTGIVTGARYSYTGKPEQLELSTGGKHTWITNTYETGTDRLQTSMTEREDMAGLERYASYGYQDAGGIKSINDTSRAGIDNQCFTYDPLGRLTAAWAQGTATCASDASTATIGGPAPYKQTFAYDATGNRAEESYADPATFFTRTYTTPTVGHRITEVTQTGSNAGTNSYTYDDAGNVTERAVGGKTENLTWDNDGTLAKITDVGAGDTTFVYDATGNRLLQKDATGATLYLPGMELRQAVGASAATATRYYGFGGATVAQRTSDSKVLFLAGDHQGSDQVQIDASYTGTDPAQGAALRRQLPFGSPRGTNTGTWIGTRGFVGGTTNPTSIPLTHLGAREYDPALGRFTSVDPVFDGGDPQSWNGYAYADNTPVNSSDPSGLCPPDRCGKGITNVGQDHPTMTGGCGLDCGPAPDWSDYNDHGSGTGPGTVQVGTRTIHASSPAKFRSALLSALKNMTAKKKEWVIGHYGFPNCNIGAKLGIGDSQSSCSPGETDMYSRLADEICSVGGFKCDPASGAGYFQIGMDGFTPGRDGAAGLSATGGLGRGSFKGAGSATGCNSFVAGTKVLMADGTSKPIEQVRTGDKVLATDPKSGRTKAQKVVAAFSGAQYNHLIKVSIDAGVGSSSSGSLVATEHHLFWDQGKRSWIRADSLTRGAILRGADGGAAFVERIQSGAGHPRVYDLTVERTHSFYVQVDGISVLVHNEEGGCRGLFSFRQPNSAFPPDARVAKAMKKQSVDDCYVDCSDIALNLRDAAGGTGKIVSFVGNGGNLRVAEDGGRSVVDYTFHHVYTDGRYAYDPRLSQTPVPWGDYMRTMRGLNPGGIRWGAPGFSGQFS